MGREQEHPIRASVPKARSPASFHGTAGARACRAAQGGQKNKLSRLALRRSVNPPGRQVYDSGTSTAEELSTQRPCHRPAPTSLWLGNDSQQDFIFGLGLEELFSLPLTYLPRRVGARSAASSWWATESEIRNGRDVCGHGGRLAATARCSSPAPAPRVLPAVLAATATRTEGWMDFNGNIVYWDGLLRITMFLSRRFPGTFKSIQSTSVLNRQTSEYKFQAESNSGL